MPVIAFADVNLPSRMASRDVPLKALPLTFTLATALLAAVCVVWPFEHLSVSVGVRISSTYGFPLFFTARSLVFPSALLKVPYLGANFFFHALALLVLFVALLALLRRGRGAGGGGGRSEGDRADEQQGDEGEERCLCHASQRRSEGENAPVPALRTGAYAGYWNLAENLIGPLVHCAPGRITLIWNVPFMALVEVNLPLSQ